MKPKQLIILGIIFCALLVGVVVKQFQQPKELTSEEFVSLDLSFDQEDVENVEIYKGTKSEENPGIELGKREGVWTVQTLGEARADVDKINRLIEEIQQAKGELRGRDKNLLPDFGITDEEAFHIVFLNVSQKILLHLLLGVQKVDFQSIFVRMSDSEEVFLTQGDLYGQIGIYGDPKEDNPQNDYWVSAKFLDHLEEESITRIENIRFANGNGIVTASVALEADPYDSTRKEWKFQREGIPFPVGADKVQKFISSLSTWKAQKVIQPEEKEEAVEAPVWRMSLWTGEEAPLVLTARKQDENTEAYPVKVSSEPVIYQVSKYYFERMDIDDSQFVADNPLQIDPEKTKEIVIRKGKKEWKYKPQGEELKEWKNYLSDLQEIRAQKFIFDSVERKKAKSPAGNWISAEVENLPLQVLDVAGETTKDENEYYALMRDSAHPFVISKSDYQKLFDDLDRLEKISSSD